LSNKLSGSIISNFHKCLILWYHKYKNTVEVGWLLLASYFGCRKSFGAQINCFLLPSKEFFLFFRKTSIHSHLFNSTFCRLSINMRGAMLQSNIHLSNHYIYLAQQGPTKDRL
jgi:hypothetical protein